MAIGKNKRLTKGKKGGKTKIVDPFSKKEWYRLRAPSMVLAKDGATKDFGTTLCSRTQGTKIAEDSLKGRVYEVLIADLQDDDEVTGRKVKLYCEEVKGHTCFLNFHGMDVTRDRLCRMIKKWHSLIEAYVNVRTSDGYHLRIFAILLTQKEVTHQKWTCYAQTSKKKKIRERIREVIKAETANMLLADLVKKLAAESIPITIKKKCSATCCIGDVLLRKVKVIRKPKFEGSKAMEIDDIGIEELGETVKDYDMEGESKLLSEEITETTE